MYRLVVVDDEQAIRRGMCNYIDWNAMDFEVVADFEDGKETIEYIKNHPVDVILTDIEMAEVSGLELARYIWEEKLPIKVVILSGYKEFEYARKAIEYDVKHYLLKPIRMDEIQRVFMQIKGELDEQKKINEKELEKTKDFQELLPELQEQFWTSLLMGGFRRKENIEKKKELLNLNFNVAAPCAIVHVSVEMNEDTSQMYYQQRDNRYNLLNNIFGMDNDGLHFYPVYLSSEILKVIVTSDKQMDLTVFEERLRNKLEEKKAEISVFLTIEMNLEEIISSVSELAERKHTMQMHVQEKDGKRIQLVKEDAERLQQKYRLLMEIINDGEFEALENLVENLFFEFRKVPLEELKPLLIDMFSMLSNKFMKMSMEMWQDVKNYIDYQQIMEAEDRNRLKEICLKLLGKIYEVMENYQSLVSKNVIDKAVEYMKEHYCEDLSLDMLADQYYLNPTYFSRMFRQYRGVTFTDYLIELRMKKAQALLLQGKYKIYEVSSMVGYKSDKYFYRVFKQYTNQSPTEFCRNRNLL